MPQSLYIRRGKYMNERARLKKCVKCGAKKPLSDFGTHSDTADGRQSYCKTCKNALNVKARQINVNVRLKHHIATRVIDQLGLLAPPDTYARIEELLGYRIKTLTRYLRTDLQKREPHKTLKQALEEGYHVDHIYPLSKFPVVQEGAVDWGAFRECWALENLTAIPAAENLAKGSKVA